VPGGQQISIDSGGRRAWPPLQRGAQQRGVMRPNEGSVTLTADAGS